MVSRIPTISFKRTKIRREYVLPVLVIVGVVIAALTSYPWVTLIAVGLAYILSIPLAVHRYGKLVKQDTSSSEEAKNKMESVVLGPRFKNKEDELTNNNFH